MTVESTYDINDIVYHIKDGVIIKDKIKTITARQIRKNGAVSIIYELKKDSVDELFVYPSQTSAGDALKTDALGKIKDNSQ